MCSKNDKIATYDPNVLLWGKAANFHGYSLEFIKNYVSYIYVDWFSIQGLKRYLAYRNILKQHHIKGIKFTRNINKINKSCSFMVGFFEPTEFGPCQFGAFKGLKILHLMDYYLNSENLNKFLLNNHVDYVMGHNLMDVYSPLFRFYFKNYIGKVISVPFGYEPRFKCYKNFRERINKAVGLGSINPIDDPLLPKFKKCSILKFFGKEGYMHPLRKFIQDNSNLLFNEIDSFFPNPKLQKDFSYDAVEKLNSYTMFVNDCGISNFPPARTFEGIACGCVMVAENNKIYEDLGFIPDFNYIAFPPKDYQEMINKISFYQNNPEKLLYIQKNSIELSKEFSHKKISEKLYSDLQQIKSNSNYV